MGDARLLVGSRVHARVKHIRSAFMCALLLGSRGDQSMANGVVLEVTRSKIGGRASTTITVRFECLGKTAVKTLGLQSIRAVDAPDLPRPPPSTSTPPRLIPVLTGIPRPLKPHRRLLPRRRQPTRLGTCLVIKWRNQRQVPVTRQLCAQLRWVVGLPCCCRLLSP